MSGHSKWANIKHRKGAQDAARSKVFMKLSKEIMVAASGPGGGNLDTNAALKTVVSKAKSQSMPKANIEKAIAKGAGSSKEASNFKEYIYSGNLPGGAVILVVCLTDNLNRTISNIKLIFSKANGTLGKSGVIPYNFEHKGIIQISKSLVKLNTDEFMLQVLDFGAEDFIDENDIFIIKTNPSDFNKVKDSIEKELKIEEFEVAEIMYVATEEINFEKEKLEKLERIIENLENDDDVQDVYSNINFSNL